MEGTTIKRMCARTHESRKQSCGRTLLSFGGQWFCREHLPADARLKMQENCSHSLGFGLGKCCFCGKPSS